MPACIWLTAMVLGFCAAVADAVWPDAAAERVKDRQVAKNPKASFFMNQYPAELDKPHPLRNWISPDCKSLPGGGILGAGQTSQSRILASILAQGFFGPNSSLSSFSQRFACFLNGRS